MKKKLRFKDFFKSSMIIAVVCFSQISLGQGTETISNLTSSATSYGSRTWTGDNGIANWNATDARADQTITGKAITLRNGTLTFQLSPLQLSSGIGDLTLKAKAPFGSDVGSLQLVVNGNVIASKTVSGTSVTTHTWTSINVSTITSIIINQTNSGSRITIDDISWTGYTSTNPNLVTSPSILNSFIYTIGTGPSTSQSFNLSGTNLTGFTDNITVTGSANYEVSTDNLTFGTSATIQYTSETLTGTPIYIRLKSGLAVGNYNSEIITISGGGDADGATVTCNGNVLPPAPSNDLCVNATILTLNGVNLSGTLLGSTYTSPFTSKNDVWYSFTPTCTGSHVLTVSNFSGDVDVAIFSNANSCPANTTFIASAATTNSTEIITSNFTTGVTYFVRVLAFDTAAESTFDINVVAPTPVTASVTTGLPSLITQTSATLNASNAVFGVCPSTTIKGFVYAETLLNNDPILGGSNVLDLPLTLGTAGSFNAAVTTLTPNVNYTYKAYLYDGATYTYGANQNFTTLIPIPDAPLALDATSINDNQFTANWNAVTNATSYSIDVYKINSGINASDLFISEYVEGSSSNKYIEIFNGTGSDVDLSNYKLQLFSNGSSTVSNDNQLSGVLANNSTIVYSNSGNIYGGINYYSTSTNFNGDDAVALFKISTNSFVDIFGRIGNDPGSAWSSASNTTSDETLVRKSNVFGGITTNPTGTGSNAFSTLEDEWVSYPTDYVSNLGLHVFDGGSTIEYVTGFENLNVGNVLTYDITGLESGTKYYYRVRAVNSSGTSLDSNVIEVTTVFTSVTWNGTTWTNTVGPDSSMDAIIEGVYSTSANLGFNAKTVTVNSGSLTVNSNTTIEIQDELVNNMAAANVIVESDGILRQINNASNVGQITVRRNSADALRLDYTAWSSPVAGQNALAFSPLTLPNRFYDYNPTSNVYESITPSTTDFSAGKGILIRTPNNWSSVTPAAYPGEFTGVPNNGNISTPVLTGFNLLGNPYSSPISAEEFLENINNSTTLQMTKLYFWTHTSAADSSGNYAVSNYATYNLAGGVGIGTQAPAGGKVPDGIIQVGQGFIVDVATNGNAEFNNAMRLSASNGQFFKNNNQLSTIEKHRMWLGLTSPQYNHNQILIGYIGGATNAFDPIFDAEIFGQTNSVLYSSINSNNSKFVIQSRALPFNPTDVVPVGFIAQVAGPYTISLNHVDGLFDSQDIYLKDNVLNVTHDIKAAPYTFTSTVGEFANRFEIVYAQPLSVSNPQFNNDSVVVYNNDLGIHINSGSSMIDNIKIFDIRGRLLTSKTNINENVITLANDLASNQVLIIQVESTDNQIVTKKIVN